MCQLEHILGLDGINKRSVNKYFCSATKYLFNIYSSNARLILLVHVFERWCKPCVGVSKDILISNNVLAFSISKVGKIRKCKIFQNLPYINVRLISQN